MKIIRLHFLLIGFSVFLSPLLAETPEQVVSSYFNKLQSGGISTIAPLMHPDELRKFREMMTPIIEAGLGSPQAIKFQKFADPNEPAKMKQVSDADFINLFMEWVEAMQPGMTAILKSAKIEPVGHVVEGDLKHVVVRMKVMNEGVEIEKLSVVSVKDFQGVPKMVLTGEMKGIAESLKRKKSTPKPAVE